MPARDAALANFSTYANTASASGAACSLTVTAVTGLRFVLHGFTISGSSACSTAVQVTVSNNTSTIDAFRIPAAAFAPIVVNYGSHPPIIGSGNNLTISIPSLGSGVLCDLSVRGSWISNQ